MARKPKAKPKREPLTDEQRHARFVEMAREVGATEDAEAFDEAFKKVVRASPPGAKKPNARR
ncbi:MAG: hypothetical protein AB7O88_16640 [Reyranellaceae bacterium]